MQADAHQNHHSQIGSFFDRCAADAWVRLTSDALELIRK
jgi:hypothetical protein